MIYFHVETISMKKQALLLEEVQKLNRENSEKSDPLLTTEHLDVEAGAPPEDQKAEVPVCTSVDSLCEDSLIAETLEIVEVVDQGQLDDKQAEVKLEETLEDVVKESEDTSVMAEEINKEVVSLEEEAPELIAATEDEKESTPARS